MHSVAVADHTQRLAALSRKREPPECAFAAEHGDELAADRLDPVADLQTGARRWRVRFDREDA